MDLNFSITQVFADPGSTSVDVSTCLGYLPYSSISQFILAIANQVLMGSEITGHHLKSKEGDLLNGTDLYGDQTESGEQKINTELIEGLLYRPQTALDRSKVSQGQSNREG